MSNESEWIFIKQWGNEWSNDTLYINPKHDTAKVEHFEITYWGHHDESETKEYEESISIQEALRLVWPDEEAISKIMESTRTDYSKKERQTAADICTNKRSSDIAGQIINARDQGVASSVSDNNTQQMDCISSTQDKVGESAGEPANGTAADSASKTVNTDSKKDERLVSRTSISAGTHKTMPYRYYVRICLNDEKVDCFSEKTTRLICEYMINSGYCFLGAVSNGTSESECGGGGTEAYQETYFANQKEYFVGQYMQDYVEESSITDEKTNGWVSLDFSSLTVFFGKNGFYVGISTYQGRAFVLVWLLNLSSETAAEARQIISSLQGELSNRFQTTSSCEYGSLEPNERIKTEADKLSGILCTTKDITQEELYADLYAAYRQAIEQYHSALQNTSDSAFKQLKEGQ